MDNRLLIHLSVYELEQVIKRSIQDAFRHEIEALNNKSDLLNIQEAASLLNLAVNTIYEKTSERTIPYYKHGKKIMFKKSELLAWVESRKVKTIQEIRKESETLNFKRKLRDH